LHEVVGVALPKSKIPWILLFRILFHASPCQQFIGSVARELPVAGKPADIEVDIPRRNTVGIPA
jgi:hypothetical protein